MFFVLWRTAAFEADQGKVCDSLGALLLSSLSTPQNSNLLKTLYFAHPDWQTILLRPIFGDIGRSALFVPNTELTKRLIKWPAVVYEYFYALSQIWIQSLGKVCKITFCLSVF